MTICRVCKENKTDRFFRIRKDTGKRRTECIACNLAFQEKYRSDPKNKEIATKRSREWRSKNPELYRDYFLKKTYGISLVDWYTLNARQGGTCAICFRDAAKAYRGKLFVDHCHESGKARGLLCANCNTALGHFEDSIERLESAIAYLKLDRSWA